MHACVRPAAWPFSLFPNKVDGDLAGQEDLPFDVDFQGLPHEGKFRKG